MFVLVRHAHAGDKRGWPWPDEERPLSELGRRQAEALVRLLADVPVRRLVSSPVLRCRQTLEPLARAHGLPVEDEPLLEPDAEVEALERFLRRSVADGTVVCSHGEYLDRLLTHAVAGGQVRLGGHGAVDTAKGAAWVVDGFGAPDATARYLPPEPPDPSAGG